VVSEMSKTNHLFSKISNDIKMYNKNKNSGFSLSQMNGKI